MYRSKEENLSFRIVVDTNNHAGTWIFENVSAMAFLNGCSVSDDIVKHQWPPRCPVSGFFFT